MKNISLKQNLRESWNIFINNWKLLVSATIILLIIGFLDLSKSPIISFTLLILKIIIQIGFIKIILDILDNKNPKLKNLFNQYNKFLDYFGLIILVLLIFLLFNLPILILISHSFLNYIPIAFSLISSFLFLFIFPRILFSALILIDNNQNPFQALKTSFLLSNKTKIQNIFVLFSFIILNVLGVLLFGIGIIVSIPLSQIFLTKYYRQISNQIMPLIIDNKTK